MVGLGIAGREKSAAVWEPVCERRGQVRERDDKKGSKPGRMARAPEGYPTVPGTKGARGRGERRGGKSGGGGESAASGSVARAARKKRGSPGDQWTQPRGALHSLGYYVVSPPLRSNTMPAATYYARRYYTGRPSVSPRARLTPGLSLSSSARRSPTAHFPLSHPRAVFAQLRASPLALSPSLPFAPFVGATRAPTASRANFDPPMATRRRLPRAGKLISPRIHAPSRFSPSSCASLPGLVDTRATGVGHTSRGGGRTHGRRPPSGDENSVSSIFAGGCRIIGLCDSTPSDISFF